MSPRRRPSHDHKPGSSAHAFIFHGGTGVLKVDDKEVAGNTMERSILLILQWDESFDIGSDTLTGVNDDDYKPPFPLTAKLNKLTIKVDRPQLSPKDIKTLEEAMQAKAAAD